MAKDDAALDKVEADLAQHLHPDLFATRGDAIYKKAQLAQAAANAALAALRDPFMRAELYLQVTGSPLGSAAPLPQDFLIDMLERQEELADGVGDDRRRIVLREARAALKSLADDVRDAAVRGDGVAVRSINDRARYWKNLAFAAQGRGP